MVTVDAYLHRSWTEFNSVLSTAPFLRAKRTATDSFTVRAIFAYEKNFKISKRPRSDYF